MTHGATCRVFLILCCAPVFVPPIWPRAPRTSLRSQLRSLPERNADLGRANGFFPYTYADFQRTPEEVWTVWEAAVPDEQTRSGLAQMDLPEASRWALLVESLRWAARGHDFLSTWAESAQGLPKETLQTEMSSQSSASTLIRLAVKALAELLARSRQPVEKSEFCALLWFLEFSLSEQARDEKQISDMWTSVLQALQDQKVERLDPGVKGADLLVCVGDVLRVIHECCSAMKLKCPWPKDISEHGQGV